MPCHISHMRILIPLSLLLFTVSSTGLSSTAHAQFGDWPDVFDPTIIHTLNLDMDPADWATIQTDDSLYPGSRLILDG